MISLTQINTGQEVRSAIAQASAATGADFDYLLKTAARESSLNPSAKAESSSAAGLFQFIEQTWFGVVKRHGAAHGLGAFSDAITRNGKGGYVVADPELKQEILALRHDAGSSAKMAGELTNDLAAALEARLGRKPTDAEIYLGHFMGPRAAGELIDLAERDPMSQAAESFTAAANANKAIFFDGAGQALGAKDVVARLTNQHGGGAQVTRPASENDPIVARGTPLNWFANRPASATRMSNTSYAPPAAGVRLSPMMVHLFLTLDPLAASKSQV
jgi:hypothetical protein